MQLDYMENLAREYNKSLQIGDDLTLLTDCRDIIIRQIELLSIYYPTNATQVEVVSYIRSLKETALQLLQVLISRIDVPKPRYAQNIKMAQPKIKPALVKLQVDLFTTLDLIRHNGGDVVHLLDNETRATAFLAML